MKNSRQILFLLAILATGLSVASAQNNPPNVSIAPLASNPLVGQNVTLTANASDPDGDPIVSYFWVLESYPLGSNPTPNPLPGGNPITFKAFKAGDYYVRVEVKDSKGAVGIARITVHMINNPPVASINPLPSNPFIDQPVTLTVTASDPDGHSLTYAWFVDATSPSGLTYSLTPTGSSATFRAPQPGYFTIRVRVSDGWGGNTDAIRTIQVVPPPTTVFLDPPQISVDEGMRADILVSLSGAVPNPVTVGYRTRPGTANEADYVAASGIVTFAPGETEQVITIQSRFDALYEPVPERFFLDLFEPVSGGPVIGPQRTTEILILDGEIVVQVPDPPPFNFTPEGPARHICLPPYMVWDPGMTHYWWVKAAGGGDLVIDFIAFCVNTAEVGSATISVFLSSGGPPIASQTVSYPTSSVGAEAHAPAIILPSPAAGEIFRIDVRVAPAPPGINPARHYRMEFDGASLVGARSPNQEQPEHHNARWGFNVLPAEGATIVVNPAPEAAATSATVRVEDPAGVALPPVGLGAPVVLPTTSAAGMWKVSVLGADGHYIINKSGGTDPGLYVGPFSDIEPPLFTSVPGNLEFSTEPGICSRVVNFDVRASDNCGQVDIIATPPSGSVFGKGTTTVTVRATDGAGNFAERTFTVTIKDGERPAIVVPPTVVEFTTTLGSCSATVDVRSLITVGDNCEVASVTWVPSGDTFPKGETIINVTATDGSGNSKTNSFKIFVKDVEPPALTVPDPMIVRNDPGKCDAVVNFKVFATDNCGSAVVSAVPASGSVFPVGTTTVNVTATDGSGNSTVKSFTVTVKDEEPPVLTLPTPIVVRNDPGKCDAVVAFEVRAVDNCSGATVSAAPASGSVFIVGTTTVNVTATDGTGNSITKSFTVTVKDEEPPILTIPEPIVVRNDPGKCGAVVNFGATAVDNCSGATVTSEPASGSVFPVGTTTVTVTATDGSGNRSAAKSFTITVKDEEPPVLTLPSPIVVRNDPGKCEAVVTFNVSAIDNCSGATVSAVPTSGTVFPVGTTTVNVTATDGSGNSVVRSFTVTVKDEETPILTVPGPLTFLFSRFNSMTGCNFYVADGLLNGEATDNCSGATVTREGIPQGNLFPVGKTTITYRARDAAGNEVVKTQTVEVIDDVPPRLSAPPSMTVFTGAQATSCEAVVDPSLLQAIASDNCPVTITRTPDGNRFPVGSTTITYTATDPSGNTTSAIQVLTVVDNTPPKLTVPGPVTVTTGAGATSCSATVPDAMLGQATATDNCGGSVSISRSGVPGGNVFPVGASTVTYTATDMNGNTVSLTQSVTVLDNTPPTITAPANIVVGNDAGKCSAVVNFTASASDNCTVATVNSTPASGTAFDRGTTTVTVEATDVAGNKSQATFTVTVEDREAPKITCPANITAKEELGKGYAVVNYPAPTATDNCGVTVTCLPLSGSQFPVGTTEVLCTAVDEAGNKSTCTFKVTVTKIVCFTMVSVDANFTGKGWKGAKQVPVKGVKVVMLPKGPVQANVQNLLDAQSVWSKLSVINAIGDPVFETDATGKVMTQSSVGDPNGWAVYIDLTNATGVGVVAPPITKGSLQIAVANTDCAPQKKFTVKLESDGITTTASFDRQANLSTSDAEGDVTPEQALLANIPTEFALYEAYPNPFNPTTTIQYDIATLTQVRLVVYDLMGREVKVLVNGERSPGQYSAVFNAEGLPSGMYFYHLRAGNFASIRKLVLLK